VLVIVVIVPHFNGVERTFNRHPHASSKAASLPPMSPRGALDDR
jgi:hypothetical protein